MQSLEQAPIHHIALIALLEIPGQITTSENHPVILSAAGLPPLPALTLLPVIRYAAVIPMLSRPSTEPASLATDRPSTAHEVSEGQGSPGAAAQRPKPWMCRPAVRLTLYAFLVLFLAGTLAWGIIPRIMDPTYEQHIQEKKVMVGMTRQQALQAWGSPYQTNVTHTNEGIRREEWIYEDWINAGDVRHRYLYFEEGILVGGHR